jgi:hypothetical protein
MLIQKKLIRWFIQNMHNKLLNYRLCNWKVQYWSLLHLYLIFAPSHVFLFSSSGDKYIKFEKTHAIPCNNAYGQIETGIGPRYFATSVTHVILMSNHLHCHVSWGLFDQFQLSLGWGRLYNAFMAFGDRFTERPNAKNSFLVLI